MEKKGKETKSVGLYVKLTPSQRKRLYEVTKRLGLSASNYIIAATTDQVSWFVETQMRQKEDQKTNAKVLV